MISRAFLLAVLLSLLLLPPAAGMRRPGDETEYTFWELLTASFTGLMGDLFYLLVVGAVTGAVWIRAGAPMALALFTVLNAALASLLQGPGTGLFGLMAVLGLVGLALRALVMR